MMAILSIILFVIQINFTIFAVRKQSETWNFQTTIYSPVCIHSSSTCVSSGVMQAGHFNRNARRLG